MYVFSNSKLNFHCGISLSYLLLFYLKLVFSSLELVGLQGAEEGKGNANSVVTNFIL